METSKKTIISTIAVILLIGLAIGGYFFYKNWEKSKTIFDKVGDAANKIIESATKGTLPSIETNPLENKPDINPVDKTNPFKNIKTNPFE